MSEQNQGLAANPSDWPRKRCFMSRCCFPSSRSSPRHFHPVSSQILRAVHVGFLLLVVFLCFPARGKEQPWQPLAWLLGLAGMATAFYQWYFEADLIQRFR